VATSPEIRHAVDVCAGSDWLSANRQSSPTLSGGASPAHQAGPEETGQTLQRTDLWYILDEPDHRASSQRVKKLVDVLQALVDQETQSPD